MTKIEKKKANFLQKYNPTLNIDIALSRSVNAAVQHNILYSKELAKSAKTEIRNFWFQELTKISTEFKKDVSISRYEEIIDELKFSLNTKYKNYFDNKSSFGSGLRTSHAQKSISVFIKHLWCLNKINEPRICPIDRIILSKTEAKRDQCISWGYVNSIIEHRQKFEYVIRAAKAVEMSVATWELLLFDED